MSAAAAFLAVCREGVVGAVELSIAVVVHCCVV